jgi:hypothetical protein
MGPNSGVCVIVQRIGHMRGDQHQSTLTCDSASRLMVPEDGFDNGVIDPPEA